MAKNQNNFLFVGLGNPGPTYSLTYHNLGFIFIDLFTRKLNVSFAPGKGQFYIAHKKNLYFIKPTTYMNLSGIAIEEFFERYIEIPEDNIIVVHDDLDLPKFSVKMRFGGSSAGHKGIESIIYSLESEDFWRIKIGIGRVRNIPPKEYVLSRIDDDSLSVYLQLFEDMSNILQNIEVKNIDDLQGEINALRKKYVESEKEE